MFEPPFGREEAQSQALMPSAYRFFARHLDDIDSIAKGHWIIKFRRPNFAHVQRNSEDDNLSQIGRQRSIRRATWETTRCRWDEMTNGIRAWHFLQEERNDGYFNLSFHP